MNSNRLVDFSQTCNLTEYNKFWSEFCDVPKHRVGLRYQLFRGGLSCKAFRGSEDNLVQFTNMRGNTKPISPNSSTELKSEACERAVCR